MSQHPRPRPAVAYVTSHRAPDAEVAVALAAFERAGLTAEAAVWDDPAVQWERYAAAVVRSTWDYPTRRPEFLAWAHRAAGLTRLCNPAPVLERNTDKTYLRELSGAGVPVVPTVWVGPGEQLGDAVAPWPELVVKPAVSVGARDTLRTSERAAAVAHAAALAAAGRTAMVQPYLSMVEGEGETSLLFLGGEFSHAVRRGPMLAGADGGFADETRQPDADQLAVAEQVLAALPERADLLYARVDLVRGTDGAPLLIELELTEPRLFLHHHPDAADRLAAALRSRIDRA
ncbi:RimK family alpha-L-glutamate ligase [Kitasatospora sp. NPDC059571]|uniref:ATP-grasp domain-containing protein n=1 Tax=Kitasatospora sp. NPDC059571 TaxID=3346871 RepID=UPI0036788B8F